MIKRPRKYAVPPTSIMAKVTAGLKRPPLIRKNTHAFTASDIPKHREIYSSLAGFADRASAFAPVAGAVLTTLVPPKAKRRKRKVPTNSPAQATRWPLMAVGKLLRIGIRRETVVSLEEGS